MTLHIDVPLNQRVTIQFADDDLGRGVRIVILNGQDGTAASNAEDWANGEFALDDLLWTLLAHAQIEVAENGETTHYTGETFDNGGVLVDLDGVAPVSVTFEDYEPETADR